MTRARLYLDTNVFIAAFETDLPKGVAARRVLAAVDAGIIEAMTSELTLAELLVKPLRDADSDLAAIYRAVISPESGFSIVPVGRRILEGAAGQRARVAGLKLPDAIHLATAVDAACSVVASGDRALPASPNLDICDLDSPSIAALVGDAP